MSEPLDEDPEDRIYDQVEALIREKIGPHIENLIRDYYHRFLHNHLNLFNRKSIKKRDSSLVEKVFEENIEGVINLYYFHVTQELLLEIVKRVLRRREERHLLKIVESSFFIPMSVFLAIGVDTVMGYVEQELSDDDYFFFDVEAEKVAANFSYNKMAKYFDSNKVGF